MKQIVAVLLVGMLLSVVSVSLVLAADDPVIAVNAINFDEARQAPPFSVDDIHSKQLVAAMKPYGLKPGSLVATGMAVDYLPVAPGYFVFGSCYNSHPYRNDAYRKFPGYLQKYEGGWFAHYEMGEDGNHITFFGLVPEGAPGPAGPEGKQGSTGNDGGTGPEGKQGPGGPAGNVGADGSQGLQGFPGAQGPEGKQGPVGPSVVMTYQYEILPPGDMRGRVLSDTWLDSQHRHLVFGIPTNVVKRYCVPGFRSGQPFQTQGAVSGAQAVNYMQPGSPGILPYLAQVAASYFGRAEGSNYTFSANAGGGNATGGSAQTGTISVGGATAYGGQGGLGVGMGGAGGGGGSGYGAAAAAASSSAAGVAAVPGAAAGAGTSGSSGAASP